MSAPLSYIPFKVRNVLQPFTFPGPSFIYNTILVHLLHAKREYEISSRKSISPMLSKLFPASSLCTRSW